MGLLIWTQEGNTSDLSSLFLPPEEKQVSAKAADTPSYLDEWDYAKAPEKSGRTYSSSGFSIWTLLLVFGVLYAVGVIKL